MFIIKWHKSVFVTFLGVVCGVIAMYFAFSKIALLEVPYLRYSLIFLVLAGVCDMFDGKVARMCKRTQLQKEFGIQIDSLADTVNFLCVPVVILLSLGLTSIIDIIIYILFILCGLTRLAYFDLIATTDEPVKYYNGLPVTSTAIIYPVIGLLHGIIDTNVFNIIYISVTALTAFLFVFKFKVPKFKGKTYFIVSALAILLIILLMVIK